MRGLGYPSVVNVCTPQQQQQTKGAMKACESLNVALLACSVLFALWEKVPSDDQLVQATRGILAVVSPPNAELRAQQSQFSANTLDEVVDFFVVCVDRYLEAGNRMSGLAFHIVNSALLPESPSLEVGFSKPMSSAIVLSTLNVSTSESVKEYLGNGGAELVQATLSYRFATGRPSSAPTVWEISFKGELQVHNSIMRIVGSALPSSSIFALSRAGTVACCMTASVAIFGLLLSRHQGSKIFLLRAAFVAHLVFSAVALSVRFCSFSNTTLLSLNAVVNAALGLSCLLSSVSVATITLCRVPQVLLITRSLSLATPHLFWYLLGVVPIFFAFALSASVLFSGDEKFENVASSSVSLFCAIFGDSLIDIFVGIDDREYLASWFVASRAFFLSFLLLFITCVLNVGLSVVQESYNVAKILNADA